MAAEAGQLRWTTAADTGRDPAALLDGTAAAPGYADVGRDGGTQPARLCVPSRSTHADDGVRSDVVPGGACSGGCCDADGAPPSRP